MKVAFSLLATGITKASPCVALLMPCLCVFFMYMGYENYQFENDISSIWIKDSTEYKKNTEYKSEVIGGVSSAIGMAISVGHNGGNMLKAERLLQVVKKMEEAELGLWTVVDGVNFTFEDVCSQALSYDSPCIRFSVLDCFNEGGYSMTDRAMAAWRGSFADGAVNTYVPNMGLPVAGLAIANSGMCNCSTSKLQRSLLQLALGSFTTEGQCRTCVTEAYESMPGSMQNVMYYTSLAAMSGQEQQEPAFYDNWLEESVRSMGLAMAEMLNYGPYNYPTQRPKLNDSGVLLSEEEVLAAASGDCYMFDGGALLPPVQPLLVFGNPQPADFNATNPLTHVVATQDVYGFLTPKTILPKMKLEKRPGGPVNVTMDQAEKALEEMKEQWENVMSAGWDDPSSGEVSTTAFTDDSGATGTFGRTLPIIAEEAVPLAFVYSGVTVVFSMLVFLHYQCALSRALLLAVGAIYAILGCYGALGLIAWSGLKVDVSIMWSIPFLLIGIGVDDMYILTLSEESVALGATVEETFVRAFVNVAMPITMTSLVNTGMFLVLYFGTDLPAVYNCGKTGLLAAAVLYLTMLVSYPAVMYLDMRRRHAGRWDFLFCVKGKPNEAAVVAQPADSQELSGSEPGFKAPEVGDVTPRATSRRTSTITSYSSYEPDLAARMQRRNRAFACTYKWVYRPLISTWVGSVIVISLAITLCGFAAMQMMDIPVGLDLEDFFPDGHQSGRYSALRAKYFPSWPVTMNWGEIDYTSGDVQMEMAQMWEQTLTSPHIASKDVNTNMVWTAALALWAIPPGHGVGGCLPSDPFSKGSCGPRMDPMCTSTWQPNTLNLRLASEGGICYMGTDIGLSAEGSYCPVLSGLTQEQFAECVKHWRTVSLQYDVVGPGLPMQADGKTPQVPIRISSANGYVLYAVNLFETNDYVDMIEYTRTYVDDKALWAWMSGIAFSYWEQYLDVVNILFSIAGFTVCAGWVVGFLFLLCELSIETRGTLCARICVSMTGAFLISLMSMMSLGVTVGFCAWNGVKMSGFTAMSCVLSIGFSVEYSVHIVHRFLEAPKNTRTERMDYAMQSLFHPVALAFLTTFISVMMMGYSDLQFVRSYFFTPLFCATLASGFFGAIFLPVVLQLIACLPRVSVEEAKERASLRASKRSTQSSDTAGSGRNSSKYEQAPGAEKIPEI
mmetsp:Transcript_43275/g.101796  ORF Transcript_43275/g.101796 Transcript_43275/m.101796 type:complete len:1177 (+) Transcript_43275:59-3589(+)